MPNVSDQLCSEVNVVQSYHNSDFSQFLGKVVIQSEVEYQDQIVFVAVYLLIYPYVSY